MSMCQGPGSFTRATCYPDIQAVDTAQPTQSGFRHGRAKETQGTPSRHKSIPMPFSKQMASFGIYVSPRLTLTLLTPKLTPKPHSESPGHSAFTEQAN